MSNPEKKVLELERFIFFSDAIVAIAITLLALDLKLNVPGDRHLTFWDLLEPWKKYLAFILSFINIAGFWQTHHTIFSYIKKIDGKMLFFNLCWLFLIVILPFTTSLISSHFTDTPAVFLYCMNIFMLSLFQNLLWDYGDNVIWRKKHKDEEPNISEERKRLEVMFNLDMLNGIVAIIVSFISPVLAFILLFFKIPLFIFASFYIAAQKRKGNMGKRSPNKEEADNVP
jgi:uncharacterized membrane protein